MTHENTIRLIESNIRSLNERIARRRGLLDGTLDPHQHWDELVGDKVDDPKKRKWMQDSVDRFSAIVEDYEESLALLKADRQKETPA